MEGCWKEGVEGEKSVCYGENEGGIGWSEYIKGGSRGGEKKGRKNRGNGREERKEDMVGGKGMGKKGKR